MQAHLQIIHGWHTSQHHNVIHVGDSAGHGRDDTFIGVHHSQKLHDKYGGEKQLITFPGDHNSMRQDHFYRRVQRFFKAVLIDSPEGRPCRAFAHVEIEDPRQVDPMAAFILSSQCRHDIKAYAADCSSRPWHPAML